MPIMLPGTESPNIEIIPLAFSLLSSLFSFLVPFLSLSFAHLFPPPPFLCLSLSPTTFHSLSISFASPFSAKDLRLDRYNHRSLTCGHESIREFGLVAEKTRHERWLRTRSRTRESSVVHRIPESFPIPLAIHQLSIEFTVFRPRTPPMVRVSFA